MVPLRPGIFSDRNDQRTRGKILDHGIRTPSRGPPRATRQKYWVNAWRSPGSYHVSATSESSATIWEKRLSRNLRPVRKAPGLPTHRSPVRPADRRIAADRIIRDGTRRDKIAGREAAHRGKRTVCPLDVLSPYAREVREVGRNTCDECRLRDGRVIDYDVGHKRVQRHLDVVPRRKPGRLPPETDAHRLVARIVCRSRLNRNCRRLEHHGKDMRGRKFARPGGILERRRQ